MEEMDIKQQFHLLHKQIEAGIALTEEVKLNLVSTLDTVKIEVEVLKRFMERYHPDFGPQYARLREEILQEVDPEWIETKEAKKKKHKG